MGHVTFRECRVLRNIVSRRINRAGCVYNIFVENSEVQAILSFHSFLFNTVFWSWSRWQSCRLVKGPCKPTLCMEAVPCMAWWCTLNCLNTSKHETFARSASCAKRRCSRHLLSLPLPPVFGHKSGRQGRSLWSAWSEPNDVEGICILEITIINHLFNIVTLAKPTGLQICSIYILGNNPHKDSEMIPRDLGFQMFPGIGSLIDRGWCISPLTAKLFGTQNREKISFFSGWHDHYCRRATSLVEFEHVWGDILTSWDGYITYRTDFGPTETLDLKMIATFRLVKPGGGEVVCSLEVTRFPKKYEFRVWNVDRNECKTSCVHYYSLQVSTIHSWESR